MPKRSFLFFGAEEGPSIPLQSTMRCFVLLSLWQKNICVCCFLLNSLNAMFSPTFPQISLENPNVVIFCVVQSFISDFFFFLAYHVWCYLNMFEDLSTRVSNNICSPDRYVSAEQQNRLLLCCAGVGLCCVGVGVGGQYSRQSCRLFEI